jgi:hypothetical protein
MLERLVYVSRAVPGITRRDTYDIIRGSHNRNSAQGLTGGLLLVDGHFVQVLEGDRIRVRARYEIITRDPRHTDLQLRQAVLTDTLMFPGEWMALRYEQDIPGELRSRFGYAPGLPAAQFDGERTAAFVLACCSLPVPSAA